MTICRIEWVDHHGSNDEAWWSKEDIIKRSAIDWVITTIGEVLCEDDSRVTLCFERGPDGEGKSEIRYRKWITIMKTLITSRRELHEGAAGPGLTS